MTSHPSSNNTPDNPSLSTNKTTNSTYADKIKNHIPPLINFMHPKDNQAIVFNCISDYRFRDYLMELKDLVKGPRNIIATSKVSNNRIIIVHLKDDTLVENFMSEHGGFYIGNNRVKCRRLKASAKKIILSIVSLGIPNDVLENHITDKLGLQITSGITFLCMSSMDEFFVHVVS